jgi:hypothetical protein
MFVWLSSPIGAAPARAAGCHVPERPILASPQSPERPGEQLAWELMSELPAPPPVLTRVPCPGEVPQITVGTIAAMLLPVVGVQSPPPSGPFLIAGRIASMRPHRSRLDRPPR